MHKEFLQQKDVLKDKSAASILDKYGGEQYLQSVPKELRSGQTENYVEYDRRGKVIKGIERAKARSKYDEDSASPVLAFRPAAAPVKGAHPRFDIARSLSRKPSVDLGLVVPAHDGPVGLRMLPLDDQGFLLRYVLRLLAVLPLKFGMILNNSCTYSRTGGYRGRRCGSDRRDSALAAIHDRRRRQLGRPVRLDQVAHAAQAREGRGRAAETKGGRGGRRDTRREKVQEGRRGYRREGLYGRHGEGDGCVILPLLFSLGWVVG